MQQCVSISVFNNITILMYVTYLMSKCLWLVHVHHWLAAVSFTHCNRSSIFVVVNLYLRTSTIIYHVCCRYFHCCYAATVWPWFRLFNVGANFLLNQCTVKRGVDRPLWGVTAENFWKLHTKYCILGNFAPMTTCVNLQWNWLIRCRLRALDW